MADDNERLVVAIEARIRDFEKNMLKAQQTASKNFGSIEARAKKSSQTIEKTMKDSASKIGTSFSGAFKPLAAGLAGAFSTQQAMKFIDASTRITNGLKVAGLEGKNLTDTYQRLGKIALDNGAGFEALTGLYSKVTAASKELGVSSREVEEFTRRMAVGLRASGTDAGAASAGIMQLNQALASGALRGDEFNSVAENLPVVAKAIADGLGVTIGKLREMAANGELTARVVFSAFMRGSQGLDAQAAKTAMTFSQSFENIKTALTMAAGEFNATTGASQGFADAVNNIVVPAIVGLGEAIENTNTKHGKLAKDLQDFAQATGIEQGVINVVNALKDLGREADPLVLAFQAAQTQIRAARATLAADFDGIADDFAETMAELKAAGQADIASDLSVAFVEIQQKIADGTVAASDFDAVIAKLVATGSATADKLAGQLELIQGKFQQSGEVAKKSFDDAGKALADALGAKAISTIDALAAKIGNAMPEAVGKFSGALKEAVGILAQMDASTAAVVGQLENFSAFKLGELNTGPAGGFLNFGDLSFERDATAAGDSMAAAFIRKFEGFRTNAYWDVNAYRAGYGSDTTTDAAGKVSAITANSVVSLADANRDLARRLVEFQRSITKSIGADTWASFTEEQQAALTSITYNYGSLPERIVAAIKTGSPETVGRAIRDLGDDNNGINRDRRAEEANQFYSGSGSGNTPDQNLAKMKDHWTGLREVTGEATAAVNTQMTAYQNLGQIAGGALSGLASALSDGKLEAGELIQILGSVAKQIIQMPAFNLAPAGTAPASGGAGFFASLISAFFGGMADGGPVSGPGGPRADKVPAMLSNGEFVVNAAATAKHRALLDAINNGTVARLADGGPVGGGRITLASAAPSSAPSQAITINAPVTVNGSAGTK